MRALAKGQTAEEIRESVKSEEERLLAACEANPASEKDLRALHDFYSDQGQRDKVLPVYKRFIDKTPYRTQHHYNYASILERCNNLEESRKVVNIMLEHDPNMALTGYMHIKLLSREDRYQEALDHYEQVLKQIDVIPRYKKQILYEVSKIYDKLDQTDKAMQTAEEANRLMLETQEAPVDSDKFLRLCVAFDAAMQPDIIERLNNIEDTQASPEVVFMAGFPRSGTTLTHQILSCHSEIVVTEEIDCLNELISVALREYGNNMVKLFQEVTLEDIARYRRRYWEKLSSHLEDENASVVIDKLPLHSAKMPFIKLLFPKAKIIFIERHPFDCCLSGFMQSFEANNAMANFATLRGSLNLYAGSMKIWLKSKEYLELDYHRMRYEDLTVDMESEARKLIDFLGLEWEDGLLEYDKRVRERYVNTPSYRQVSQPIYQSSKERWRRYRNHFEPYFEVMKPYLDAMGYGTE